MRTIAKILSGLLAIGLVILLGYVAYVYVLPHWCALLFYTYFIVGFLMWSAGFVKAIIDDRHGNWAQVLTKALHKANRQLDVASRFNRLRDTIALIASIPVALIVWPVDGLFGIIVSRRYKDRKLTNQEFSLLQAIHLPDSYKSLFALFVVIAILGLTWLGVDLKKYGPITLALMIASASFRHVSYLIGTESLPARLRRVNANSYALFLVLAVADFCILILGLTALESRGSIRSIAWSSLVKTGRELLQGEGALLSIFKGARPSFHQIVVSFVGLLFSLTLLKIATQFREFKRKDEDFVWLAKTANTLGNYSDALRYLRNVRGWDTDSRAAEIIALFGVNQIDDVAAKVKSLLEHERKPSNDDIIFANMVQAFLSPRMPQTGYLALLKRGVDANVPDALMQDCVGFAAQNNLRQQTLDLFADVLPSFPLTVARIHVLFNEPAEAIAVLEAHPPTADLDVLIGRVMWFAAHAMQDTWTEEESIQNFAPFAQQTIPLMRKLLNASQEQWQRATLFVEIQRSLQFAQLLGKDRVEELRFLADSLADQQPGEEFKRTKAIIAAHFE